MGDRCDVYITLRESQVKAIEAAMNGGFPCEDVFNLREPKNTALVQVIIREKNYGVGAEDMPSGVPLYGSHTSGDDYGPYRFAWDGEGTFLDVPISVEGHFFAVVEDDGSVRESDIKAIREFVEFEKTVKQKLETEHGSEREDV
jgi:hypothetical protein